MQPRPLDLMRQVTRPIPREFPVCVEAAAQVHLRHGPRRRVAFGASAAMITIGIDGRLREDRARPSALEDKSGAVLLGPHEVDGPAPHEMHNVDSVTKVKYRRAGSELAFAAPQFLKKCTAFLGHDFYHVPGGRLMARCV